MDNSLANDKLDAHLWENKYPFSKRVWRHLRMRTSVETRDVDGALMDMIAQMNEDIWAWRIG